MKKVISILLVLCVAVTLFAAGSVKVGGAFNFVTGATRNFTAYDNGVKIADLDFGATYKTNGFGFDVAGDFDVAKDLVVWADFNMVFGADAKFKLGDFPETSLEDEYKELKDELGNKAYKVVNVISLGAGAAYKLALDSVDVKLGGGLFLDRALGKAGAEEDATTEGYEQFKAVNLGVALYADASYKFNKNFGIGITVMPHIGLYNSAVITNYYKNGGIEEKQEYKAKGFKLSYAMPIVFGVSYSF